MAFVEVDSLHKKFGSTQAVCDLGFHVERGELFGFLGPNGAGKSTTLSILCGLLAPDSGEVLVGGESVLRTPRKVKQRLGIVPQDIALYPRLSARTNLTFWGRMYGLNGRGLQDRIDGVLELVGLTERADDKIAQFSGGMKRRANIAAGLLHRPDLLVLDEPTAGVDPQSRNNILEMIRALQRDGTTVIYTTHYMEEAETLCDRVAIVDHGQIIAQGTPMDLRTQCGEWETLNIWTTDPRPQLLEALQHLPQVSGVSAINGEVAIVTKSAAHTLPLAFAIFQELEITVTRIELQQSNLESLFLTLTGRTLRD